MDKRIDVVASTIQFGKTVYDLVDLELAYAPPFSSAKDPVNIAGMVAKNMLKEDYRVIHWDEIESLDPANVVLVDLRTSEEFEIHAIAGAINIPLVDLRERATELAKDKTIVVYCQVGKRGYFATKMLKQLGFADVVNLSSGYKLYQRR